MTISATDIVVPACSKTPLLYLLTQKVAQKFGYVLGIVYFRRLLGKGRYPSADDPKWFLLLRYVDENDVRFSRFLKDMQKSFGRIDYTHVRFAYLSELVFALPT